MSSRLAVSHAPGILAAGALAVASRFIADALPGPFAEATIAVLLGLIVGQLFSPALLGRGVRFVSQRLLRVGIVLLGARLSLDDVLGIGTVAIAAVIVVMAMAFITVTAIGRAMRVDPSLTILLAVGAAVCGNTAVIATAPIIRAPSRFVAYAVATVTLFGTLAIIMYPLIGAFLHMPSEAFGIWAGVAINDTSQVVAAGASYSTEALEAATVVKLMRNTMLGPILIAVAWWWSRGEAGTVRPGCARVTTIVPAFVIGFLALAFLRTIGLITPDAATAFDQLSRTLILLALAGVGLSIRLSDITSTGAAPIAVGFLAAVIVGAASLAGIQLADLGH